MWVIPFLLTSFGLVSVFTSFWAQLPSGLSWSQLTHPLVCFGHWHHHGWSLRFPLFFVVKFPAGPISLVIGRDGDNILPYSLTQAQNQKPLPLPREMCLRDVPCSKQTRSVKGLPLVQRSHLTFPMILRFFTTTSCPICLQPHFQILSIPSH